MGLKRFRTKFLILKAHIDLVEQCVPCGFCRADIGEPCTDEWTELARPDQIDIPESEQYPIHGNRVQKFFELLIK